MFQIISKIFKALQDMLLIALKSPYHVLLLMIGVFLILFPPVIILLASILGLAEELIQDPYSGSFGGGWGWYMTAMGILLIFCSIIFAAFHERRNSRNKE